MTTLSVGKTLTCNLVSGYKLWTGETNVFDLNVSYLHTANLSLSGNTTIKATNLTLQANSIYLSATNLNVSGEFVAVRPYMEINYGQSLPVLGGIEFNAGGGNVSALSSGSNFVGWGVLGLSSDSIYTTTLSVQNIVGTQLDVTYFRTSTQATVGSLTISCVSNSARITMTDGVALVASGNVLSINCEKISCQRYSSKLTAKGLRVVNGPIPTTAWNVGYTVSIPIADLQLLAASSAVYNFGSVSLAKGQYITNLVIQHTVSAPVTTQFEATLGLVDTNTSTPTGLPFGEIARSRMPMSATVANVGDTNKRSQVPQTFILAMSNSGTKYLNLSFNTVSLSQTYTAYAEFTKIC